ncbi:MAG: hypothetical protein LBN02_07150 [Oscillospiraceae bacterium]|jgi:hypothetical protein|nr:hypothetical protein [Oscillospiraceae bacterium]
MAYKPNLAETPFGRRDSRHMVVDQGGTLWLALASEAAPSLVPTAPRPAGLFEINALRDGKPLPYTYDADDATITISAADATIAITHDTATNALRFEAHNVTLRLDGKNPAGVSSTNKPNGTEVNIGGGKYFFIAPRGTISFDDTWVLASFGSVTPILDVAPDADGKVELIAYDLPADTVPPPVTKTFGECILQNKADFAAFSELLKDGLSDEVRYKIWLNSKKLANGHWCITPNRVISAATTAVQQAIASLAFKDGDASIDVLLSIPEASPPLHGYVAAKLLKSGASASGASRLALAKELERAKKWWDANRWYPGGYYYAYRFETGFDNPPDFRDNGYAPDAELAELVALHQTVIDALIDNSVDLSADIDLTKFVSDGLIAEILKEVK